MIASVIVIAHNGLADLTIPFLDHLAASTLEPHQLICVDDGSNDGTFGHFQSVADSAIRLHRRSGVAAARNAGMMAATGDILAFIDNDAFPPVGWLSGIGDAMSRHRVGIVGGIPSNELWRLREPRSSDGLIDSRDVSGACMAVSRHVFETLGYLNTKLVNAGEDTDYCFRAWLAGYRVVSAPDVVVRHGDGKTRKRLDQGQIRRSQDRFWRKWRPYVHLFPIRYPEVNHGVL